MKKCPWVSNMSVIYAVKQA